MFSFVCKIFLFSRSNILNHYINIKMTISVMWKNNKKRENPPLPIVLLLPLQLTFLPHLRFYTLPGCFVSVNICNRYD